MHETVGGHNEENKDKVYEFKKGYFTHYGLIIRYKEVAKFWNEDIEIL